MGGEEFAVLLPQTDRAGALILAENLRAAIETAPWPNRAVTVSIGAATFDNYNDDSPAIKTARDLMNCADKALYTSKKRGRNCVS